MMIRTWHANRFEYIRRNNGNEKSGGEKPQVYYKAQATGESGRVVAKRCGRRAVARLD
jgi:hypothetical protein